MKKFVIFLSSFLIFLLLAEVYLHNFRPSPIKFDPELGWKLKANFDHTYEQKTLQGQKYQARFQTNKYGFRTYGHNDPNSLKILVLGDSFTADAFSSNEEAWFTILAQEIERNEKLSYKAVVVWAGGAGGYGTLQELILAKRIKFIFSPDILILQFCINDFSNNHLPLESSGFLRQLYLRRPYLNTQGEIEFSNQYLAYLYRSSLFQNSRIINKIDSFINHLEFKYHNNYSKKLDPIIERRYKEESLKITQSLLNQMSNEFPNAKKIIINCSLEKDSLNQYWLDLASTTGFTPIPKPTEQISKRIQNGEDLLHADGGHWNATGNKVFGQALYNYLYKSD